MIPCFIIGQTQTIEVISNYINGTSSILFLKGYSSSYQQGLDMISQCRLGIVYIDVEQASQCCDELLSLKHHCCLFIVANTGLGCEILQEITYGILLRPLIYKQYKESIRRYGDFLFSITDEFKANHIMDTSYIIAFDDEENDALIRYDNLRFIQAMENYVILYPTDGKRYVKKVTMSAMIKKLPYYFSRVHRSYIINDNYVETVKGDIVYIINSNRDRIPIGGTFKVGFLNKEYIKNLIASRRRKFIR